MRAALRKLAASALLAALLTVGVGAAAFADGPAGNSGHSNNGSTQCKAGGNDHCPPFGNDQ